MGDFVLLFLFNKFACANFRLLYSNHDYSISYLAAVLSTGSRTVTARSRAAPVPE